MGRITGKMKRIDQDLELCHLRLRATHAREALPFRFQCADHHLTTLDLFRDPDHWLPNGSLFSMTSGQMYQCFDLLYVWDVCTNIIQVFKIIQLNLKKIKIN